MTQWMPPAAPITLRVQRLASAFHDPDAPGLPPDHALPWRIAAFLPAVLTTGLLAAVFLDWFRPGGLGGIEVLLVALICLTFFWIAFSVSTATVGIMALLRGHPTVQPGPAMRVALLMPVYNETPADVFGNAAAMLADLARQDMRRAGGRHRYDLFILSDSRDAAIADAEERAFHALRADWPGQGLYYRRRAQNTDRKTGNLSDWLAGWGAGYPAMLVLDADSLMTGAAIVTLTDALAGNPSAGIIQSLPQIYAAGSLFGRVQQFAGAVYGRVLGEGLAQWAGDAGNFWGHNAILRTRAFADCAVLPYVGRCKRLILSHDFVEAALMRRAGWAVRFLPQVAGSYEEAPQTLIDYVLRDRRWCQGNLQHLALLGTAGLHPVSRFHMVQGACSYLMSPAWFVLLTFWALLGNGEASVITYFTADNPMFPMWPETSRVNGWWVMGFMYGMLLVPKAMGMLAFPLTGLRLADMGGAGRFTASCVVELAVSVAFAPVMMLQQMIAVLRTVLGYTETWVPPRRGVAVYPLAVLARFHALETLVGLALVTGMAMGAVSLWLLPIAASLVAAVPLSALSALDMAQRRVTRGLLATPEVTAPPQVICDALAERAMPRPDTMAMAAE